MKPLTQKLSEAEIIIAKAKDVRTMQKQFFKGDKNVLNECRIAEKELDKMIVEFYSTSKQTSFF